MFRTPSPRRRTRSAPPGFRSRWRLVSSTACSALALVAAGCGDGGDATPAAEPEQTAAPALPAELAESLAADSDEIAALLAADDAEGARKLALKLRTDVERAEEAGEIPAALADRLLAAIERLLAAIPSEEEAPTEVPAEDSGKKDDKKEDEEAVEEEPVEEEPVEEEPVEETEDEVPGQGDENGNAGGNGKGNGNGG